MAKAPRKKKPKSSSPKRTRRRKTAAATKSPLLLPAKAASATRPTKPAWSWVRLGLAGAYGLFALIFAVGLIINIRSLQLPSYAVSETTVRDAAANSRLRVLSSQVSGLETAQEVADVQVVSDTVLEQQLSQIQVEIQVGQHREAEIAMDRLATQVSADQAKLNGKGAATTVVTDSSSLNVPILVYHKTPADFDRQLKVLEQKNYHTITMAQLAAALHGLGSLPPKPVVISFDDGFANQMDAFSILQRHHMVAIFYIIDGGANSRWCIGAGRRYNDPLQPPTGCGDAYLSWDQVRQLDHSGIVTIGSHTVDHENLASEPPPEQQFQIAQGKQELEAQLGHSVHDFAYPYGSFNAATLDLVQQAGFATAVTTTPGTTQSLATIYTLRRVRDPNALP